MRNMQTLKDKGKIRYRPGYSVQYGPNGSRTVVQIDTDLTQAGSPDVPPSPFSQAMRDRREAEQAKTHEVYFLYACGRIKIGVSNHALRRVMREISPCCPAPLHLIGTIPGGPILEARLHERFSDSAMRDEWFFLDPELREYLCEDRGRAGRLTAAEKHYRDWLKAEAATIEPEDGS